MRWVWGVFLWATAAQAVTCDDVVWSGLSFSVCQVDASEDDLRIFHARPDGSVLGNFSSVEDHVGRPLVFAMNAGMYHIDRSPVGLLQQNGVVRAPIVLGSGPGNFGLLPNGVFCIREERVEVTESSRYAPEECRDATQSGPMLVIDGELHPRFLPNGTSKNIRNGVGTTDDDQTAIFVISNEPVNFHTFGSFFKDFLGVKQALYFDGKVSRLYAPEIGRADVGLQMGPIVGVLE